MDVKYCNVYLFSLTFFRSTERREMEVESGKILTDGSVIDISNTITLQGFIFQGLLSVKQISIYRLSFSLLYQ